MLPKVSRDLPVEQLLPIDVLQVDVSVASLGVMDFHKRLVNQNLSCSLGGYKMIILISQKSITRKQRNKNIERHKCPHERKLHQLEYLKLWGNY